MNNLKECIVVAGKFNKGNVIISKNRDRPYLPRLQIVHRLLDLIEIVYLEDLNTGWVEGMNEYHIGIINSALLVDHDEKENKIAKATGKKSEDRKRILRALTFTSIEDSVNSVAYYDGGVRGHSFVCNHIKMYHVECTGRHDPIIREIKDDQIKVQTNHGFTYPDVGYQFGIKYLSSKLRKSTIENLLKGDETAETILDTMTYSDYDIDFLNPMRRSRGMFTTSQVAMDLRDLKFYFRGVKNKHTFEGINNKIPKDHDPKIKIIVLKEYDIDSVKKAEKKIEITK